MAHRTFSEMLEVMEQCNEGLVSEVELILALQCDEFQIAALLQYNALPPAVASKIGIIDFDEAVQDARAKAAHVGESSEVLVTDAAISTRVANILLKNSVQTVQELAKCSVEQLLKFPNMGPRHIRELHEILHAYGLTFANPGVK